MALADNKREHTIPLLMSLALGDVVLLPEQRVGVIRYCSRTGKLKNKLGIEIRMTDGVLGNTDGIYQGERYFQCAPNAGIFIEKKDVSQRLMPEVNSFFSVFSVFFFVFFFSFLFLFVIFSFACKNNTCEIARKMGKRAI